MILTQGVFVDELTQQDSGVLRFLLFMGCVCLLLSMFFPTTYQQPRGVYLIVVFSSVLLGWFISGRTGLSRQVALIVLFFVIVGTAFVLYGLVRGAPGAHRVASVHIIWPVVYTVLISGMRSERAFRWVMRTIVVGSIAISVYAFSFLLNFIGILPAALYFEVDVGQGVVLYDGYVEFTMHSIATMVFAVPFLLGCLIVWPKDNAPVSRSILWVAFFLAACFTVLTARRALWLICALAPFIIAAGLYFFSVRFRVQQWRLIRRRVLFLLFVGVLCAVILVSMFDIELSGLTKYFVSVFDIFTNASGGSQHVRYEQFHALMDSWQAHPVFGSGLGEGVQSVIRSSEQEWAYELSYLAILHQMGLFGFLSYGAGIGWIYLMSARIIRSGHWLSLYLFPTIVGLTTFLIANATNPYLAKFDFIWVIFLPVAMINYWLVLETRQSGERNVVSERVALQPT